LGRSTCSKGIGFILGGETLTKQSFPEDMLTGGAVEVGAAMHWPLGVACIVIGIILFSTRSLPLKEAKKGITLHRVGLYLLLNQRVAAAFYYPSKCSNAGIRAYSVSRCIGLLFF
jgi:hypothetical protein